MSADLFATDQPSHVYAMAIQRAKVEELPEPYWEIAGQVAVDFLQRGEDLWTAARMGVESAKSVQSDNVILLRQER